MLYITTYRYMNKKDIMNKYSIPGLSGEEEYLAILECLKGGIKPATKEDIEEHVYGEILEDKLLEYEQTK